MTSSLASQNLTIILPESVKALYAAHKIMCQHYAHTGLTFTLDGKLLGDIAEALVAEAFEVTLSRKRTPGVDGHTLDDRSVQIKGTARAQRGPAFTPGKGTATHLIFIRINFEAGNATVLYNGLEAPIRRLLPQVWSGTKVLSLPQVLVIDAEARDEHRLPRRR